MRCVLRLRRDKVKVGRLKQERKKDKSAVTSLQLLKTADVGYVNLKET